MTLQQQLVVQISHSKDKEGPIHSALRDGCNRHAVALPKTANDNGKGPRIFFSNNMSKSGAVQRQLLGSDLVRENFLITSHSSRHGEKAHETSQTSLKSWPRIFGRPGSVRHLRDTALVLVQHHIQNPVPRKQKHQGPKPRPRPSARNRRQARQHRKARPRPRTKRKPRLPRLHHPRARRALPSRAHGKSIMQGQPGPRRR